MNKVPVNITGPLNASEDDLINGGREVIARHGYQVGDASGNTHSPNSPTETLLQCELEVDDELYAEWEQDGEIDLGYGDFAVWAFRD